MKKYLIALFLALLVSSPAIARNFVPIINDQEGTILVDLDATKKITVTDMGPIRIQGSFLRAETLDKYTATVDLSECIHGHGTIRIGKNQTEQWLEKNNNTFDLVAKYLCEWARQNPASDGAD